MLIVKSLLNAARGKSADCNNVPNISNSFSGSDAATNNSNPGAYAASMNLLLESQ